MDFSFPNRKAIILEMIPGAYDDLWQQFTLFTF